MAQHYLSLGQMIDGFRQLSDEDRQAFLLVTGLQPRPSASGAVLVHAPMLNTASAPPIVEERHIAVGAQASQMAAQGLPGYTKDPKSGKLFRIAPKVVRTQDFLGLENNSLRAKQALNAFVKRNGWRFDRQSGQTLDRNGIAVTPTREYENLVSQVKAANAAVKAYKEAHPEQFRPPTNKGKGRPAIGPVDLSTPPTIGGIAPSILAESSTGAGKGKMPLPPWMGGNALSASKADA